MPPALRAKILHKGGDIPHMAGIGFSAKRNFLPGGGSGIDVPRDCLPRRHGGVQILREGMNVDRPDGINPAVQRHGDIALARIQPVIAHFSEHAAGAGKCHRIALDGIPFNKKQPVFYRFERIIVILAQLRERKKTREAMPG